MDLDGDGVVGATDLLEALAEFGSSGPGLVADVSGDQLVGVNDVLDLLASYGESCP